jgi:hypothetical protein
LVVPNECWRWIKLQRTDGYAIEEDFRMIEPYLPDRVESILDIGCGMAGIDVLLKRKFPHARLELLDGDGEVGSCGFTSVIGNSRKATEALLKANGVECDRWHEVGTKEELKADLVISLLSWGFHYPLDTYRVKGFCIADLRRGKEDTRGVVIAAAQKYRRCAFVC